jgi:hypothetical protein
MEQTPKWLAPVVLGGAGALGGLVLNYAPTARAALNGALQEAAVKQAASTVVKVFAEAIVGAWRPASGGGNLGTAVS